MSISEFTKTARKAIFSTLRSEDFSSSGAGVLRVREPVIQAVAIGGSPRAPDRIFFELGVHLSFLPPEGRLGFTVEPKKFRVGYCDMEWRCNLSQPGSLGGWQVPSDALERKVIIEQMLETWASMGRQWFDRYAAWPNSFLAIIERDLEGKPNCFRSLRDAEIAVQANASDLLRRVVEHAQRDLRIDSFTRNKLDAALKRVAA